ncbi:MAG: anhydro-N-acetylmuramic acid kinase [Alphaproteobacteria bacterium]|nr:anhydro-N-acetylmuramic acid kinase [Alphaproteobacteria bacterium]
MADKRYRVLGLMSGTSIDAIDVAFLETDGQAYAKSLGFATYPYTPEFRQKIRGFFGIQAAPNDARLTDITREQTLLHAGAVKAFMATQGLAASDIDLIGFHGQTLWHSPATRQTLQIGDGTLLAAETGINVVYDFRTADVKAGGQGAPLVPLYHRALAAALPKPLAILNIGGVSNITWIGGDGDNEILAYDVGPGNALIDDWVLKHTGQPHDHDGAAAALGVVDEVLLERYAQHPFFAAKPPKSLDRDAWGGFVPQGGSFEDGAATLTMMTVRGVELSLKHMLTKPQSIYVCGGGRHNKTMMRWLAERTRIAIHNVDVLGWDGDALEAEAFAYLAVRSVLGLPLSVPGTTGVPCSLTGGVLIQMQTVS